MSDPNGGPTPGDIQWPSVSVIIPVLNEERHLEQAVNMVCLLYTSDAADE